jgi:hypothetical protein
MIASIIKIYTENEKYDRLGSLDYKLTIFYNICRKVRLLKKELINAFPTMLKGIA